MFLNNIYSQMSELFNMFIIVNFRVTARSCVTVTSRFLRYQIPYHLVIMTLLIAQYKNNCFCEYDETFKTEITSQGIIYFYQN
jgi:hypothetical protein